VDADALANPFRHANLRLLALLPEGLEDVPFLCECDDPACFAAVRLSSAEFEQTCSQGEFVIVRGHRLRGACKAGNA
jgi:hypothetical protein